MWKDVVGYEGNYKVSNFGEVYSLISNKMMKLSEDRYGYLYVELSKNGMRKKHKIHRLVSFAFLKVEETKDSINHKDENKKNNRVDNLEWCNVMYNNHYNNRYKILEKEINQFSISGEFIKKWDSAKKASEKLNIPSTHITKNCKRKSKTTHGFVFRYINEEF
ncbi:MAG: NUMOD4 domain-containing protein [Bacteroidales bacterium]